MLRALLPLALLAALAFSPMAAAQEEKNESSETPQDGGDAWVKDCPPDRMCAYGGAGGSVDCTDSANASREECAVCEECPKSHMPAGDNATYSGDCGAEMCAYEEGAPRGDCMDGRQGCDMGDCPHCRTLEGDELADPVRTPADADAASEGARRSVPGLALAGIAATLGLLALALRRS